MVWTKEKEKKLNSLWHKHKGTPMERYVLNIERSTSVIYEKKDWVFWFVLNDNIREQKAIYQRRTRINKYMFGMFDTFVDVSYTSPYFTFNPTLYMVTLTFRDDELATKNERTLQRYVTRYLNDLCLDYIACVDFGKRKGRIHFHAVCAVSSYDLVLVYNPKKKKNYLQFKNAWPYGYHNVTPINGFKRAYKYAFKASSYAFKNANSYYRPFHKRNVEHIRKVRVDDIAGVYSFGKVLDKGNASSVNHSSGFEVANAKKVYNAPYCYFGDTLTISADTGRLTETTGMFSF